MMHHLGTERQKDLLYQRVLFSHKSARPMKIHFSITDDERDNYCQKLGHLGKG